MAARTNKPQHEEKTKRLIQASQLINRLISHANGKTEMTASQVNAAKIVIGKAIPDLKAVEISGNDEKPLKYEDVTRPKLTREEWLKIHGLT